MQAAFWKALFAEFSGFGLPLGPVWGALGALLGNFWGVFSGSDFRLIFGMLLGGAGGRGWVPLASESEESAESDSCSTRPAPPSGGRRILRASPPAAGPFINQLTGDWKDWQDLQDKQDWELAG